MLGLFACIGILVGGCIGSAIFSLSGQTILYAGPASILSWIIAAFILALYGMQVCELAVRYPESGGVFVFPEKAIGGKKGAFWGFISAWGYIVSNFIAVSFSAIYVSVFLGQGFPVLEKYQVVLAVSAVALCLILNLVKITDAGKFNSVLVLALVVAMVVYVGFSLFGGGFDISNFENFFTTGMGTKGMFKSIPVASVAYGACLSISYMVSEVKNPNKTIPRSLLIGLGIVMILYTLMLVATIGTFDYDLFEQMPFLVYVPQFGSILFGGLSAYPWMAKVVALAAFVALITTMLVLMALTSRAIQAVSKSGLLPSFLKKENKNKVPLYATILCAVFSALLSCRPDWTETLVGLGSLFSVFSMVITCSSLIISRRKTKLKEEQYKAPLGNFAPVFTVIAMSLCYIIGSISKQVVIFTLIIYALALITYFTRRKK